MEIIGLMLIGIGAIIAMIYGIILMVKSFQVSIWWGLGYIFIPLVSLIFIIVHWQVAKDPFLKSLIAIPFIILGMILLPESTFSQLEQQYSQSLIHESGNQDAIEAYYLPWLMLSVICLNPRRQTKSHSCFYRGNLIITCCCRFLSGKTPCFTDISKAHPALNKIPQHLHHYKISIGQN